MNTELTDFLNTDSRRKIYARTLSNIFARAARLWEDGYTATETHTSAQFKHFTVRSPKGDRYTVCLSLLSPDDDLFGSYCTCPAHEKYGNCKHRVAVEQAMSDQAQADAYDAQEDGRDWYLYDRAEEAANFTNGRFDR